MGAESLDSLIQDALQEDRTVITRAVRQELRSQAEEVRIHIKTRTRRGIGVNERRFVPYAPSTAQRKGRFQPVDMTASSVGSMLDTMRTRQTRGTSDARGTTAFEVYFPIRKKEVLALCLHFGTSAGMPPRPFFGVTTRFRNRLIRGMANRVDTDLRGRTDRRRRIKVKVSL